MPELRKPRRILSVMPALLQVLVLQHFLKLAFDAAARVVQFGVVSCRPVAHTLRTPIRKLRVRVYRIRLREHPWTFGG